MIASNTSVEGRMSSAIRDTDRLSEMPCTSSALPIRSRGPVPTGWAAAYTSDTNGVRHTCIGCTRVGSPESSRNTVMVPSSNSEWP